MITGLLGVYLDDQGDLYATDLPSTSTPTSPTWTPRTVVYVPPPAADDLFRWLGWPPPDVEQALAAQAHVDRARLLVIAYTRGRGTFGEHLAEELSAVVLSLAGRSMNNPTSDARIEAGAFKTTPGQPDFLLNERLVLDGWRRRAA